MEYSSGKYKVGAVVVVYNPSEDLLGKCMESLVCQVDKVCVVDNSATDNARLFARYADKVRYIPLMENRGIAAAQNIGIKLFCDEAYDFVLFSDQDSTSPSSLVACLVEAYVKLSGSENISCIGPIPVNRKTGQPYIYSDCIIDECENAGMRYYRMHSIISSYSLVPVSNFAEVGVMSERLFIDFVDQEWCWRAAARHGKVCIMLPDVKIKHELGVSSTFLGHRISVSTPFRIYFQTRNLLWLSGKDYVPKYWKRMNLKKIVVKFFYYSIVPKQRFAYCARMLKGAFDGLFKHL